MGRVLRNHCVFSCVRPKAALQGPCFTVARTLIQKGTDCPVGHPDTKSTLKPWGLTPQESFGFSPAPQIPYSWSVYTSFPSALFTESVSLANTGPKEREIQRKDLSGAAILPLNETGKRKTRNQTRGNYVEPRGL